MWADISLCFGDPTLNQFLASFSNEVAADQIASHGFGFTFKEAAS
jgi:hypothetical protein